MNKQVSKVHYDFQTYVQRFRWIIGTKGTSEADIRSVLTKYFRIKRRFYASGSTYHGFYILEKR